MNFTDSIRSYIMADSLFESGDAVVVGVSGGADSVCLFLLLMQLRRELGLDIAVVHVNHCIRGNEADGDEEFVKALCARFDVRCSAVREDVKALAEKWKCGVEEAGRLVRHNAYADCVNDVFGGRAKVALAHHRDDLCETVMLSLIRGSGINGMAGIRNRAALATSRGIIEVIRPLLCVGRKEIESWLASKGETWRNDATNSDDDYTRNRIRHNLIPLLSHENPKATEHIARTAHIAAVTADYLRLQADMALSGLIDSRGRLEIQGLLSIHPALFSELIQLWTEKAAGTKLYLNSERTEAVKRLIFSTKGHYIELFDGYIIKKQSGFLSFGSQNTQSAAGKACPEEIRLKKPDKDQILNVEFAGYEISFEAKVAKDGLLGEVEGENFFSIFTSYDKIDDVCLRLPLPGDRMVISGSGDHKKLSRIFIDAGIPREQRRDIPVMLSGEDIVWVVGVRDCPAYFADESDEYVLLCQARRVVV